MRQQHPPSSLLLFGWLAISAALAAPPAAKTAGSKTAASQAFIAEIRPLLQQYCLGCHSAARVAGDLNLERFATFADVLRDPPIWQKVVEQLSLGEMPPKAMPQPKPTDRAKLLAWTGDALRFAALANAGDPGPVVLRRLNNAEYNFTIQDLTGVPSLEPSKEFPADGAAGEGFLNTGNALSMSPALVTKYLDAAKTIADHAVLLPSGIRFSTSTSRRDWTEEILAGIRAFYKKHSSDGGAETITQQGVALDKNRGGVLPLRRYFEASLALRGNASPTAIATVARQQHLSPKYLSALVTQLKATTPSPIFDPLRRNWRAGQIEPMLASVAEWQNMLFKFSSVGHIGKADGPKAWLEPVTPLVTEQPFRLKLPAAEGQATTVYLAAHDGGDGSTQDIVEWQQPRLVMPGRQPVLIRDVPAFVSQLQAHRTKVFAATASAMRNAAGSSQADPATAAWQSFLGIAPRRDHALQLLTKKITKFNDFPFVQGWGSSQLPFIIANSSNQAVRVPGNLKARGVAMHPSQTLLVGTGWLSPIDGAVNITGNITRAHPECGSGVIWALEVRRGATRVRLAEGPVGGRAPLPIGPFAAVPLRKGDLLTLLVGPRDGNYACALTDVDLQISTADPSQQWSLSKDVSTGFIDANPRPDSQGRPNIWHFFTEPVPHFQSVNVLPNGSLLARWLATDSAEEKAKLATALQTLLQAAPPAGPGPDATLHRQLSSLAGPLLSGVVSVDTTSSTNAEMWGVAATYFSKSNSADLVAAAPATIPIRLPADLAANSEFVTTARLSASAGAEGSVQAEVLLSPPPARTGLLPAGTAVGDAKGLWTSNNQTVSYALPVIAQEGSRAKARVAADFEQFRQLFPASLCYTKIVPVDEVVTLTLYHREDDHLKRLILTPHESAEIDRLWDELHYVSRDALTLVDAFEQLWQYATQDADPSKFEPMRQPILSRAAAFQQRLQQTEPEHRKALLAFAGRAYRRPLLPAERDQLESFYQKLRGQGQPHDAAIRLTLARMLVAPAFLYRAERAGPAAVAAPVDDFALANRLSYFLWSSQPDDQLLAAAKAGNLRTAAGLQAQAKRMLQDPRARRLATEFGAAWLHLKDFPSMEEKSERHFPTFAGLRADMYEESLQFFQDLFQSNGSVLSLLDADHTFLNEALASHYGIPGVAGANFRRVTGVKAYGRGGVLTQASILSKQAGASRTSPILRGNWVAEVLLGDKLPRPPKDVPQLPADESGEALSMRALTERHTKDPRCASCHSRIDPYGYTLESYDAIGRHRQQDVSNRPIQDTATLKDGTVVPGADGLRQHLSTKGRELFVRQFCRKLLGFALGRAVQLSDEPLLEQLQSRLRTNGYHVGSAIDGIITSKQFREIRGRNYVTENQ